MTTLAPASAGSRSSATVSSGLNIVPSSPVSVATGTLDDNSNAVQVPVYF